MRGVLVAAGVLLASGAAMAQPTAGAKDDTTGVFCVYSKLKASGAATASAEVFLGIGHDAMEPSAWTAKMEDAVLTELAAGEECAAEFMLSDGKTDAAINMGVYGAALDYLEAQLAGAGVSKSVLGRVHALYEELSESDDAEMLAAEGWREDPEFSAKIRTRLKSAGVPDKDEVMAWAMSILEASAYADAAVFSFLVDDL